MTATEDTETGRVSREAAIRSVAASAAALERLGAALDESFDRAAEMLTGIGEGKVVTLGVGKSGHAAEKVAGTLRSIGVPASYLSSLDALHGDIGFVGPADVGILFSKSGTTRELTQILPHLRARGLRLIAIVGAPDSPLGRDCDLTLDASVEIEGCPLDSAPMASVIAAQAMGDALAAAVMQGRGFDRDDFARLHPAGALGARLSLTVNDVMRSGSDLPSVVAGAALKDAIIEISRTGYGAVCVLHTDGRLAGFVTDGDIRRQLLETDDLRGSMVDDLMSPNPLTVSRELPLSQALVLLEQRKKAFLTAPVVDGDVCVGLLRLHDAVQAHLPA
ncbi:MAG TPA: KpsF/GutQ family sugar-phosphate isomerase [Thermoleophilaceae bacterium]|nr:KpsF/GutQ family sugar-phosphate isomerase [Thermoleophilaceae bacterium]